jgi:AcrR family transcriptional regulator
VAPALRPEDLWLPPEPGQSNDSLPRLPSGRHGLPRQFVSENQHDRLIAAVIATVAESGYEATTITQITAAAGLSRRTFYQCFPGKRECFCAAHELICAHLGEITSAATATTTKWPDQVKAAIEVTLAAFAANPDLARFFLIAPLRSEEPEILARHRLFIGAAVECLGAGAPRGRERPAELEAALIAGLLSLIGAQVERGEGRRLGELGAELGELYLGARLGFEGQDKREVLSDERF